MESFSDVEEFYDGVYSDSDDANCEPPTKKRRRENRTWLKKEVYANSVDAEKSIHPLWKKCSSKNTVQGLRVNYRCTGGRYRIEECPAGLYLLYHSDSIQVSLYRTDCDHSNHAPDPLRGLPHEIKSFISKKYEEGISKPNAILKLIRKRKLKEPKKSKVVAYLRTLRYVAHV